MNPVLCVFCVRAHTSASIVCAFVSLSQHGYALTRARVDALKHLCRDLGIHVCAHVHMHQCLILGTLRNMTLL